MPLKYVVKGNVVRDWALNFPDCDSSLINFCKYCYFNSRQFQPFVIKARVNYDLSIF